MLVAVLESSRHSVASVGPVVCEFGLQYRILAICVT